LDVLIVSLGSTAGLRAADAELAGSLRRAGASVAVVSASPPKRSLRTLALTDLAWALAARRAALTGLAEHRPKAIVYSSTTAALLWPRPGAIRFDAPSAGNRPGRHGLWQRPVERRRLAQAPLLLPWSEGGLVEALPDDPSAAAYARARALVLPVPVEPSAPIPATSSAPVPARSPSRPSSAPGPAPPTRDIAAIAYAANPLKKGIDRVLAAWARIRKPGEELVLAGAPPDELARAGVAVPSAGGEPRLGEGRVVVPKPVGDDMIGLGEGGVRVAGRLSPEEYRALLRRARVFVCAPRRLLVTTPAPGPYVALPIARDLDARLVSGDLGAALRAALDEPPADYASLAVPALVRFRRDACDRVVRDELLPRLRTTLM